MHIFHTLRQQAEMNKKRYPPGTRLELQSMNDPYAPVEPGTRGTVVHVDDIGQIHMRWDDGRSLALVPGEDSFRVVTQEQQQAEGLAMTITM